MSPGAEVGAFPILMEIKVVERQAGTGAPVSHPNPPQGLGALGQSLCDRIAVLSVFSPSPTAGRGEDMPASMPLNPLVTTTA